jgi:hypothetical protein
MTTIHQKPKSEEKIEVIDATADDVAEAARRVVERRRFDFDLSEYVLAEIDMQRRHAIPDKRARRSNKNIGGDA